MPESQPKKRGRVRLWTALLVFVALAEVAGHSLIKASVVEQAQWAKAAERVRSEFEPGDRIVVAPQWADPLMRAELGDLISLGDAGASDLAGVKRLWELSIRGASSSWAPEQPPAVEMSIDGVRLRRWDLDAPELLYDFTEHVMEAVAEYEKRGTKNPCARKKSRAGKGGLFVGPFVPFERFTCEGRRTWSWVGSTVMEDLELNPRRCVWQHPLGKEPLRLIYENVPVGDELRISTGLYYHHDRRIDDNQYKLKVSVGGVVHKEIVHTDGEGWKTVSIDLSSIPRDQPTRVVVETTADKHGFRSVCWHGRMLRGGK